jgi:hypothetical protein
MGQYALMHRIETNQRTPLGSISDSFGNSFNDPLNKKSPAGRMESPGRRTGLPENRRECFFVETNDGDFPDAHRRRPQISGGPEHFLGDLRYVGALHFENVELLPLRHVHLR